MKKLLSISMLISLFSTAAMALPAPSDEVVKATLNSKALKEILKENPGFKKLSVSVIWGKEISEEVEQTCAQYSKSRSIVEVQLLMKTMPSYHTRSFYLSTPYSPEKLTLCNK